MSGKCGVYEARPTQCRTFPFWPENLKPQIWKSLKEVCPGIDVGQPWDEKDVQAIAASQRQSDLTQSF